MANCVCMMTKILRLYKFTILAIAAEHRKCHAARANEREVVSDWLNPHSLGTMSAFGCIEHFA